MTNGLIHNNRFAYSHIEEAERDKPHQAEKITHTCRYKNDEEKIDDHLFLSKLFDTSQSVMSKVNKIKAHRLTSIRMRAPICTSISAISWRGTVNSYWQVTASKGNASAFFLIEWATLMTIKNKKGDPPTLVSPPWSSLPGCLIKRRERPKLNENKLKKKRKLYLDMVHIMRHITLD